MWRILEEEVNNITVSVRRGWVYLSLVINPYRLYGHLIQIQWNNLQKLQNCDFYKEFVWQVGSVCPSAIHFFVKNHDIQTSKFPHVTGSEFYKSPDSWINLRINLIIFNLILPGMCN